MTTSRFSLASFIHMTLLLLLAGLMFFFMGTQSAEMDWSLPVKNRLYCALLAVSFYMAFVAVDFFIRYRQRQKLLSAENALLTTGGEPWLVVHASQTGLAEELAWRTANLLQQAGKAVRVLPLARLDAAILQQSHHALFIASTTGEGDAPDTAVGFMRRYADTPLELSTLKFALLALGDRSYQQFCAFGLHVNEWLQKQGAQTLFPCITVDDADLLALQQWQTQVSAIAGVDVADTDSWQPKAFDSWRLVERELVNKGTQGGSVYRVALQALNKELCWQAGDIAEVLPHNARSGIVNFLQKINLDALTEVEFSGEKKALSSVLETLVLPHDKSELATLSEKMKELEGTEKTGMEGKEHTKRLAGISAQRLVNQLKPIAVREYSIASVPQEGKLEILLRQQYFADGSFGVGSSWLTIHAPLQSTIQLRIRENKNFHSPFAETPLILISNGTGIAGLRAHLKARSLMPGTRNWLVFGERHREHDYFYREDIEYWQKSGVLERVDLAFSRDQDDRIYVQDKLRESAAIIREWVDAGAAIYVCGSMNTMAPAVHAELITALGEEKLENMREHGRYRRDVY